jgi:hypothetical protein
MATAQARLFDAADTTAATSAAVPAEASPPAAPSTADDGLPPPPKAQVFYWAQLCGKLSTRGTAGIAAVEDWPADVRPTTSTLTVLVQRGFIARRDRAWKLRRNWYARLTTLKARAVDTPPLTFAERPAPHLPTYGELEQWETVCRWLDVQPGCRARLPCVGLAALLRGVEQEERHPPEPDESM